MATQQQIQSNRRNAQFSTGPRTAEGKAVSRMNAHRSGIDATCETACGEHPAELAAHYDREFQPLGVVEHVLVDVIVKNDWLLRRYRFLRADLTNYTSKTIASTATMSMPSVPASATSPNSNAARRSAADSRALESVNDSAETENPEIGFVPQTAPERAAPTLPGTRRGRSRKP